MRSEAKTSAEGQVQSSEQTCRKIGSSALSPSERRAANDWIEPNEPAFATQQIRGRKDEPDIRQARATRTYDPLYSLVLTCWNDSSAA
jgi:hypothetical protein